MVERCQPEAAPDRAECVHVAMAWAQPVDEFDAKLERAPGRSKELVLVQAEPAVEQPDLWNARFAHADRADFIGLDEADFRLGTQKSRKRGGRHPAGGPATDDKDGLRACLNHAAGIANKHPHLRDEGGGIAWSGSELVVEAGEEAPTVGLVVDDLQRGLGAGDRSEWLVRQILSLKVQRKALES